MQITTARPRITAVLGPTNTGKTHLAMERLLGHESGIIGFPLRLLARENYERAVAIKGARQVALITGEEKIVPPRARYFICTVESMPLGRSVSFLAIDEIQVCADAERGHIFTDRLLHARGEHETMFLGAETMRARIRQLVPEAKFETRPRFSTLRYTGLRKITRLPPRSAIVAFSATDVYSIAETVRRQRGGAAVVLGALSPRTRNAQVAMFQAGEVDHLVATDAIGMGLNMDVDHVAFAETRKFDGRAPRDLTPGEMAQIAGRAGRHMNDGTFGTTAEVQAIDPETVARIENHEFEPLRALYWRNAELGFTSLQALRASLRQAPPHPQLLRVRHADDETALDALAKDAEIAALANHPDAVRLLWDVCRIPDFRKLMRDAHARLLGQIYRHLRGPEGRLPTDWIAAQVARLDRTDGDIETIVQRIANVRTWTYVSFHGDWLADAGYWQDHTRALEDRLSDALHERLTQRFVDRRTAVLVRRLKDSAPLHAAIDNAGGVQVEGHAVGHLSGFRFAADTAERQTTAGRSVANAAARALGGEIASRVSDLETASDDAFTLVTTDAPTGVPTGVPIGIPTGVHIHWQGEAVARLTAGADIAHPVVDPLSSDLLSTAARQRIHQRLTTWLDAHLARRLAPLSRAREATLKGAARGLIYQLSESLGSLPRHHAEALTATLTPDDRKALRKLGIRLGRESVYMPAMIKADAIEIRALLWAVHTGAKIGVATIRPPMPGRVSLAMVADLPAAYFEAIGYRPLGGRAVRIDMLERLMERVWALSRSGAFKVAPELLSLVACGPQEFAHMMVALGYRRHGTDEAATFARPPRRNRNSTASGKTPGKRKGRHLDSPFAKLSTLAQPQ